MTYVITGEYVDECQYFECFKILSEAFESFREIQLNKDDEFIVDTFTLSATKD